MESVRGTPLRSRKGDPVDVGLHGAAARFPPLGARRSKPNACRVADPASQHQFSQPPPAGAGIRETFGDGLGTERWLALPYRSGGLLRLPLRCGAFVRARKRL